MDTIIEIRDKKCKGNIKPIEGVPLPGGFMMREHPDIDVDMRRSSIDVYYTSTFNDIPAAYARAEGHPARKYHTGVMSYTGQPTCYDIPLYPDMNLIMPPYILSKDEVSKAKLDPNVYGLMKTYGIYRALCPNSLRCAELIERNENHIFLYDNPNNYEPYARARLMNLIEKHNPSILQEVWDYNAPMIEKVLKKKIPCKIKTYEELRKCILSIPTAINELYELDLSKFDKVKANEYRNSRKGIYEDTFLPKIEETLNTIEKDHAKDILNPSSSIGRAYHLRTEEFVDNMYDLRYVTDVNYTYFHLISRYVGFKRAMQIAAEALDQAFDVSAPIDFRKINTRSVSYRVLEENNYPWMHFRERIMSPMRVLQRKMDSFTSRFYGVSITFVFDPDINHILMNSNRAPVISVDIQIDDSYLKRPNTGYLFDKDIFNIKVTLPSFVGMRDSLMRRVDFETRLLLSQITLEKYTGEKVIDWVRIKKKIKTPKGKPKLEIHKELQKTEPRPVKEARSFLYSPETAEAEGRVKNGVIEPRKADIRMSRIFERISKDYIHTMKKRQLSLRDVPDEDLFDKIPTPDMNRIIDEAKNQFFEKIVDMWVRNLQLYYSELMNVHTDFMRTYIAGTKPKNTSMSVKSINSFAYKALVEDFSWAIYQKGAK